MHFTPQILQVCSLEDRKALAQGTARSNPIDVINLVLFVAWASQNFDTQPNVLLESCGYRSDSFSGDENKYTGYIR